MYGHNVNNSNMASTSCESEKIPVVVNFAFTGFKAEGGKWIATCKKMPSDVD